MKTVKDLLPEAVKEISETQIKNAKNDLKSALASIHRIEEKLKNCKKKYDELLEKPISDYSTHNIEY